MSFLFLGGLGSIEKKCGFVSPLGRKMVMSFLFLGGLRVYTEKLYVCTPVIVENVGLTGRFFCIDPQ